MTGEAPPSGLIDQLFASHPALRRLMEALNSSEEEARIVGGAVRNALLGLAIYEIDIATTSLPQKTVSLAAAAGFKTVQTGIHHGTITVIGAGGSFEVTTLREDIETDGRHAVVRFGRSFETDARRRDFTINALSLGLDGRLHDYTGGQADIAKRAVRFIGVAEDRIREDYLRILRFFRFSAAYAREIDAEGRAACARQRDGIATLSRERIGHEMRKLVTAQGAVMALAAMQEAGLLDAVLPGPIQFERFAKLAEYEAKAALPASVVRRLAALVPDGTDTLLQLKDGLRLSNQESDALTAARAASALWSACESARAILYRLGKGAALDGLCLAAASGAELAYPVTLALELEQRQIPINPFKSRQFLERGLTPGPKLGEALRQAEHLWIERGFPTDAATIEAIASAAAGSATH